MLMSFPIGKKLARAANFLPIGKVASEESR